nr:LPS export ABC transporter periplasmic protein LptC [uncultured Desulfobulbus sp.]
MMLKNPRNLLWLLPLVLFLTSPVWHPLLGAFLTPRGGYNAKLSTPQEESSTENFVMDEVTMTLASQGMEEWRITAKRAFTGELDQQIDMEGVSAKYVGAKREPIDIESRVGSYRMDTRFLVLRDDVRITKPSVDQVLLSERLEYDDAKKTLISPGKVYIQAPNMKIDAGHMNYDFNSGDFDFTDRVKVTL